MTKLPVPISFDWDQWNIDKNLKKHGVTNKEIEEIFQNRPLKIFDDAKHSLLEKRFIAHGVTEEKRKLAIIFNLRNKKIRIISARDQSRKERRIYGKK